MGSWGYESDANDKTYNWLGIGIPARFEGADSVSDSDRVEFEKKVSYILDKIVGPRDPNSDKWEDSEWDFHYDGTAYVGIVRLTLHKGYRVGKKQLEKGVKLAQDLLADEAEINSFTDPDMRRHCLNEEIQMMQDALKHGGVTQLGSPTKSLMDLK